MLRSIAGGSSASKQKPNASMQILNKGERSSQMSLGTTSSASTANSSGYGASSNQTSENPSSESTSDNEFRAKRSRGRLTEEEYEFIARDIMAKPPMTGYLKYHLPLRYAARTEEVRWVWVDQHTGQLVHQDLIGGGRNSDLEYD